MLCFLFFNTAKIWKIFLNSKSFAVFFQQFYKIYTHICNIHSISKVYIAKYGFSLSPKQVSAF